MINRVSWSNQAIFYHIYPFGLCGAPSSNDFQSAPVERLAQLHDWIPHIKSLGCNALYLGPVFESDFHGYDTADYLEIDRRLGTNETFRALVTEFQRSGIRVVLDTVFNHTGRNFFAFRDLKENGVRSKYKDWFCGVDFERDSEYGDGFYYEGWYSAYNLVKLNLQNEGVTSYLFKVVQSWIDEFAVDGLRFDVAEIMDKEFLHRLAQWTCVYKDDFWLMGEVITGNYNYWANERMLDSATNYEVFKGLYSAHNDHNYFEIAHTLQRQFGEHGIYRNLLLYNFADNHDVSRLTSLLNDPAHFRQVYTILFTMPGIPSVYYGSEWGLAGVKGEHEDNAMRPAITEIIPCGSSDICSLIQLLSQIRSGHTALQHGDYREAYVSHEQFVFSRTQGRQVIYVAMNISETEVYLTIHSHHETFANFRDQLDSAFELTAGPGSFRLHLPARSSRIMSAPGL